MVGGFWDKSHALTMNSREKTKNPYKQQETQTGCILRGRSYCRKNAKLVWPHADVHVCRDEVIVNQIKTVRKSLGTVTRLAKPVFVPFSQSNQS